VPENVGYLAVGEPDRVAVFQRLLGVAELGPVKKGPVGGIKVAENVARRRLHYQGVLA
jgi:hypothetical protein